MATFSVTDRGTFRRCRRRWDYSSNMRKNLTNVGSGPEPLELGGLIHRALADWIVIWQEDQNAAQRENMLRSLFAMCAAQRQQEIIESFKERTGRTEIPEGFLDSLHNVVNLGLDMMANYQAFHKSPLPAHMSFASPEQEVLVPVPGTEHRCNSCFRVASENDNSSGVWLKFPARKDCEDCNGTGFLYHYLSATLDGLTQDEKDWLYVLEHKTYEQRPKPMDLAMNDQFTGYCWVVRELKIGKVAGVAYDGMWKRSEPPKYMQRERRAGKMDDLFIRKVLRKSDEELDEWGRNLALEITEMANNPEIYPNVPWQGCSDCNFQEICYMQMRGEDPSNLIKLKYQPREVVRGGR